MPFKETDETKKRREAAEAMTYQEGERAQKVQADLDALQAPDAYQSAYNDQMRGLLAKYQARPAFNYDVNSDALYKLYKDQYTQNGRQAMADAIGKASAATGGYGSSYGASVGAQAYQGYMQQLNAMVPQLQQLAYERYQQEGQDMKDLYSMMGAQEAQEYGRYRDAISDYMNNRAYYAGRADTESERDYSRWNAEREYQVGRADAAYSREGTEYAANLSEDQWNKQYEEGIREFNENLAWQREQMGLKLATGYGAGSGYAGTNLGGSYASSGTGTGTGTGSGSGNGSGSGSNSGGSSYEIKDVDAFFNYAMLQEEWARRGKPNGDYISYLKGLLNKARANGSADEQTLERIKTKIKVLEGQLNGAGS